MLKAIAAALLLLVFSACALANQSGTAQTASNPTCPNAGVLGPKLITDVCWECVFPIRIAGIPIGGSLPRGAASPRPLCFCGFNPGTQVSLWKPIRLIETVRQPYCSPSLGGISLSSSIRGMGGPSTTPSEEGSDMASYQYHMLSFPLLAMLDLFTPPNCGSRFVDMDMLLLSELDPTHNDDEMALWLSPEMLLFANPVAQAACAIDAAASSAGRPMESMFWCAGGWGPLYPMTGNFPENHSPQMMASLMSTRALAKSHRLGLSKQTMGNDAMCGPTTAPIMDKRQYKLSVFYPMAQASDNFWIGENTIKGGIEFRNVPAVGEDIVQLVWGWNDCCLTFF
jgi:conjugal transfer pilus assembly protein TraU